MSELFTFAAVLTVKLTLELVGRYSENSYLTNQPLRSAAGNMLVAAAAIPIGRRVIAAEDNIAAIAVVLASGAATWLGAKDWQRRKSAPFD